MRGEAAFNPLDGTALRTAGRAARLLVVLGLLLGPGGKAGLATTAQEPARRPETPGALIEKLESAFGTRDREGVLGLFDLADEEARARTAEAHRDGVRRGGRHSSRCRGPPASSRTRAGSG